MKKILELDQNKESQYIQVYDRPNDDPDQNENIIAKYKVSSDFYAYSTAKIILVLRFKRKNQRTYVPTLQWAAQMSVGQNTEGGRGCFLEHMNERYPLRLQYPKGVTRESKTHTKIGSIFYSKPILLQEINLNSPGAFNGSMTIKQNQHVHYYIRYRVSWSKDKIESASLTSSNENKNYAEYDLYQIGELTPSGSKVVKSKYFNRPNDTIFEPELVGAGDFQIAKKFKSVGCLDCHGGVNADAGQEFSTDFELPLYPEKIYSTLAALAVSESKESRDIEINKRVKWPRGMRRAVSKLLEDEEDNKLLLRWLSNANKRSDEHIN